VQTVYTFDELNRLKKKTYSDGTPEVSYTYDETAAPYGKGRLTKAANAYSTTAYSNYDPLGRLLQSTQTTGGQTYGFGYSYL
jgi:hypothetical protein